MTLVGAVPPDADVSADIVAAVTCACIAATTDDSLPPGGSENVSTCVTGTETICVKVMMAPTSVAPLERVVVGFGDEEDVIDIVNLSALELMLALMLALAPRERLDTGL